MKKLLALGSALALVIAGNVLAQNGPPYVNSAVNSLPYVSAIQSTDAFQDVVGGYPTVQNQYATAAQIAAYVRGYAGGVATWADNIIQNGDFLIDQQYAGASETVQTTLTRAIDRWYSIYTVSSSGGSAPATQQVALSTGLYNATEELKITGSGTATTSATAGMITRIQQTIEESDLEDLQWGQPTGGTPVTVSLWMKSSIASANVGVSLKGASTVQSYVQNCALSSTASIWTFCSFTVPAPTTGTWATAVGTAGPILSIAVQCGTTFQTTAGAWVTTSAPFYCTSAQTQFLASVSPTLEIALVKMQRGSVASPFATPPVNVNLTMLHRYLRTSFPLGTAPAQNGGLAGAVCGAIASATAGAFGVFVPMDPPLYAAPTITTYSPSASNANWYDVTGSTAVTVSVDPATAKGTTGFEIGTQTSTPTAGHTACIHYLADSGI